MLFPKYFIRKYLFIIKLKVKTLKCTYRCNLDIRNRNIEELVHLSIPDHSNVGDDGCAKISLQNHKSNITSNEVEIFSYLFISNDEILLILPCKNNFVFHNNEIEPDRWTDSKHHERC